MYPPRRLLLCLLAGGVPVLSMELSLLLREYVLRNSCRLLRVTRAADMMLCGGVYWCPGPLNGDCCMSDVSPLNGDL